MPWNARSSPVEPHLAADKDGNWEIEFFNSDRYNAARNRRAPKATAPTRRCMNEFVCVHTSDEQPGIATLLLSRPPTNALTRQVCREIVAAAAELGQRDDIAR